jgi:hypothetical protein
MGTFRWLHFSDLHRGLSKHGLHWPNVRDTLYQDLSEQVKRLGPVDAVVVTGDLTNTGAAEEFQAFEEVALGLDDLLTNAGNRPVWITVPGNHDLLRPPPRLAEVKVLDQLWRVDSTIAESVWNDRSPSDYRDLIRASFAHYSSWRVGSRLRSPTIICEGLLPGDFAATLDAAGRKIGFLGLNSAFLQLTNRDQEGFLEVSMAQVAEVCSGDLPAWVRQHDACFLLTHHPPSWLSADANEVLRSELYIPDRFVAHLFGHMHVPQTKTTRRGGGGAVRNWQCPSLDGLATFRGGVDRIHGYFLGELSFTDDTFRLWPRVAAKAQGGHRRFVGDASFDLLKDDGISPEKFERANARNPLAGSGNEPTAPTANPTATLSKWITKILTRWSLLATGEALPRSGSVVAPVTDAQIRSSLLGDFETKKVADALLHMGHKDFLLECRRYEQLIDDGDFDLYGTYLPQERFVRSASYPKLDVIHDYVDSQLLKQNLAIVGPKGSGKTLHLNCWLRENNTALEGKKVLWLRCDCHRLFDLWLTAERMTVETRNLISLEEYLALKLVYVLAKRGSDPARPLLHGAAESLRHAGDFQEPVGRRSDATEKRSIWSAFEAICSKVEQIEAATRRVSPRFRYLEDGVISETHKSEHAREFRQWLALSTAIEGYLTSQGYKFLRILDGLDNVHATTESTARAYRSVIDQAAKFIGNDPGPARVSVAVLRQRSYVDVKRSQSFPSGRPEQLAINKIELLPTSPFEILRGRFDLWTKQSTSERSLLTRITRGIATQSVDEQPARFHYNHRVFLHNRLTLARQVYYRLLQLGHHEGVPDEVIDAQVRNLSERNLLLNGRFFYDTTNEWPETNQEIGECSFNLFHIAPDSATRDAATTRYPVLLGPRVLQMIQCNGGVLEQDLIKYLEIMFGYPKVGVERATVLLRAFGMIDSILAGDQKSIAYEASQAGTQFLHRSFTNIDALYYCALDTPMPEAFIRGGLVHSHNNKTRGRTEYPFASVSTALSFLAYLTLLSAAEVSDLARRVSGLPVELKALNFEPTLPHESSQGLESLRASFKDTLAATLGDSRDREALAKFVARLEEMALSAVKAGG